MSKEEMNKKMEFIVEQQAKFAADIEMMREVQAADAIESGSSECVSWVGGYRWNLTRAQMNDQRIIDRSAPDG